MGGSKASRISMQKSINGTGVGRSCTVVDVHWSLWGEKGPHGLHTAAGSRLSTTEGLKHSRGKLWA